MSTTAKCYHEKIFFIGEMQKLIEMIKNIKQTYSSKGRIFKIADIFIPKNAKILCYLL